MKIGPGAEEALKRMAAVFRACRLGKATLTRAEWAELEHTRVAKLADGYEAEIEALYAEGEEALQK